MIAAVNTPSKYIPKDIAKPIEAVAHTVAAVVSPLVLPFSRIITPAPRNPTPLTT